MAHTYLSDKLPQLLVNCFLQPSSEILGGYLDMVHTSTHYLWICLCNNSDSSASPQGGVFCFLNKPWKAKRRYKPWKASFSVSMIKSRWYACFEDLKFESLTAQCINPRVTVQFVHKFVHTQCLLESFVDGFVSRSCDPKNPAVGFLLRFFTIWRSQTSENITTSVCTTNYWWDMNATPNLRL